MEPYINPILTIILIAIYWFNTKAQNNKIKAQSDIINDLKEHVKFFDLKKIKEYVELRESEKDKLMNITKQAVEKEFELKQKAIQNSNQNQLESKKIEEISSTIINNFLVEPYTYIALDLIWKSNTELDNILNQNFPKSKNMLLKAIQKAQSSIKEKTGKNDLNEIKRLLDKKE